MKKHYSEDGFLQYTINRSSLDEIKLLKMPKEPYTIRISRHINGAFIKDIGRDSYRNVFTVDSSIYDEYLKKGEELLSFEIDDDIRAIHSVAFSEIRAKSFHWPAASHTIPSSCFRQSRVKRFTGMENVEVIRDCAFYNSAIEEFDWPAACTEIPYACFSECENLKRINNTENVTAIIYRAFYNCTNLKSFVFPEGLVHIGADAFYRTILKEVDLSATMVEYVGECAFGEIPNLKDFIPSINLALNAESYNSMFDIIPF